jgi:hypothetical protein
MGLLDKIFKTGIKDVVSSVGSVIDDLNLSKEEKEQFKLQIEKIAQEREAKILDNAQAELETYLGDIQDARAANTAIQESDKASWLSKNFAYILDGAFCVTFGIMLFMIFNKAIPSENKELFYTGFGLLGGIVTTIINFHRGSSKGSEKSGDALRKIASDK